MKTIIAAIHGIMTNQTDPSWPDKFDAWMLARDPEVKVLKKEYRAGPFPRWNCWIKDPALARGLANELELFLRPATLDSPSIWFVAHSNGAVIALLTARILIERGYKIGGLILTGAAVKADVERNGVMEWWSSGVLGAAIAYSSPDDEVLDGDPVHPSLAPRPSALTLIREWLYGKLMFPYGCLGRTGWQIGSPKSGEFNQSLLTSAATIFTRWYAGGHRTYFRPQNIEATFEQIYQDITSLQSSSPSFSTSSSTALATQEPGDPVPINHILNTVT